MRAAESLKVLKSVINNVYLLPLLASFLTNVTSRDTKQILLKNYCLHNLIFTLNLNISADNFINVSA